MSNLIASVALLVLATDESTRLFALLQDTLLARHFRTATVLAQELTYRSAKTPATTAFLQTVRLPDHIDEPAYSFGYLWPHEMRTLESDPELTRVEHVRRQLGVPYAAIDLAPHTSIGFTLAKSAKLIGTFESRDFQLIDLPVQGASRPQADLAVSILDAAQRLDCPRLAAGLLCDLMDIGDSAAIESIRSHKAMKRLQSFRIPPGCDTENLSWRSFREASNDNAQNSECTFAELLDRAAATACKTDEGLSARAKTLRRLEKVVDGISTLDLDPESFARGMLCGMGLVDATNWEMLNSKLNKPAALLGVKVVKQGSARMLLRRLFYEYCGGALIRIQVLENGSVRLDVE